MALIQMNFRIEEDYKKDLDNLAKELDISTSHLLRKMIKTNVDEFRKNKKKSSESTQKNKGK